MVTVVRWGTRSARIHEHGSAQSMTDRSSSAGSGTRFTPSQAPRRIFGGCSDRAVSSTTRTSRSPATGTPQAASTRQRTTGRRSSSPRLDVIRTPRGSPRFRTRRSRPPFTTPPPRTNGSSIPPPARSKDVGSDAPTSSRVGQHESPPVSPRIRSRSAVVGRTRNVAAVDFISPA